MLISRYFEHCVLNDVKVDASNFDVYSVFGFRVNNNTCKNVEIKVKSYVMLGYKADKAEASEEVKSIDGVSVIAVG